MGTHEGLQGSDWAGVVEDDGYVMQEMRIIKLG